MYVVLCCDVLNRLRLKGHPIFFRVYLICTTWSIKRNTPNSCNLCQKVNTCDIVKKWHFRIGMLFDDPNKKG